PLHACALAEELEIDRVLVPESAGVLSALGLVASDERRDTVRSYVRPLEEAGELPHEGGAGLRYPGPSFELPGRLGGGRDALAARFHEAHEDRYGYADRARTVELVAVRTAEVEPGPALDLPPAPPLEMTGPAVVELDGATCWVPQGWVGVRDGSS